MVTFRLSLCLIILAVCLFSFPVYCLALDELKQDGAVEQDGSGLLSLDYKDVDIKDVARAFSALSGVNIIVSSDVQANITMRMSGVDWRTALEVILDTYNLAYVEKSNFIIITTLDKRRMQEESGLLDTEIIRLNFVDVNTIRKTLTPILSSRGVINIDERTNSLVITDIKDKIKDIKDVATKLDIRTPQVLIETMVVDVKLTDEFKWGVVETLFADVREGGNEPKWKGDSNVLSLSGASTFKWGKTIFSGADLNLTLQSIMKNTKSKILANPRVVTLDNLSASIDIITQEPYTAATQTGTQDQPMTATSFKDIGIKLIATPHITKDKFISMEISTEHSVKTGSSGGVPIVDMRKASTNVLVKDGETIVMGGLRRRDVTDTVVKIPVLGDIPVLGRLFRSKDNSITETELVIFITPHLVGEGELTKKERMQLELMKQIRDLSAGAISFKDKELLPMRPPQKKDDINIR
ncbi:MAG: secretin N-terminal domain-containing protein [Candidatus Omnitrophota bacterium]